MYMCVHMYVCQYCVIKNENNYTYKFGYMICDMIRNVRRVLHIFIIIQDLFYDGSYTW